MKIVGIFSLVIENTNEDIILNCLVYHYLLIMVYTKFIRKKCLCLNEELEDSEKVRKKVDSAYGAVNRNRAEIVIFQSRVLIPIDL